MIERHVITGEYPPQAGGVSDYTSAVAHALAEAGERVHVWCRGNEGDSEERGVIVHRSLGRFAPEDLARLGSALDAAAAAPRRLLVQWVPHAYGRRALNLGFCRWLSRRASRAHDDVEVMVHEPFLPFRGGVRQRGAAAIQRLMTATVIRAARRVWVATPAWAEACRPYARRARFGWTPVPSGVPLAGADSGTARQAFELPPDGPVVGSFGRGGDYQYRVLLATARRLGTGDSAARLLLIGAGSVELRARLAAGGGVHAARIVATGSLPPAEASRALLACTAMVQPYADGVCGRHSSIMAALAHGLPVVTTEGRFTEALWRESRALVLVPVDPPEAVAHAVAGLVADAEARRRLSRAARGLYADAFDVRHTVAALQGSL